MGKNFTKKLLPLALTAAMIVPSVPAMAAPSDIAGHWAESVITQWQSKGLIQGYEDGTFKPGNTITRAEFVTLMNNAKGFWSEGSINFSDVKNGSWFYSAVARAVAAGYVKGYSDGSFKPGNTITRAEAAVMIANAARLSANEAGAYRFTDVGSIPAWARGSVGAVVAAGYMTGYPDGSFYANASISRAEAVSSLNRMLGGTAYQPTQPTTPTTDTTKTTSDDVVIEDKGTTLKNQTVDGNVTIAKSVGNGDVTLRNVTIKGDLIVKGGGSNTVTLEDVDVRGKARLLKEGVHLHLVGDTDIRKTDTSNGATAPKENGSTSTGGSSGGSSGTASKEITGAEKVTRDVPYGTSADDALAAIPKTVTLKLKGGSTTTTTVTNWKWADGVSYNATPTENTNYKATTTVTIPSGYTYNGTLTAEATVTVHPLDKTKLEAAKNAYMDLQNKQTYDEKEAATDKEKILIKDSTPDQITAGVRFATPKDWRPLDDAIKSVENQERIGFASQQKCDDTAKTLQAAIDDFIQNKVKVGTSKTTDAYILQQVKDELLKPDKGDYAYSSKLQPLKSGSAYPLYMGSWTADNGVYVDIQWTATGEGTQYVTKIEDSSASGNDTLGYYELNGIRNTVSRGALIGGTPDKPTEVTFTATVKNSMTQKEIGTIDYTALIGAPISVSANQPSTVPQFTVISDGTSSSTGATKFTGVVPITLNGAEAITDVSDGCVTMDAQSTLSDSSKVSFSHISVDKVEKSDTGLNVTVTVTTGAIGGVWDENSPYPFKEGILPNISIDTSKLQLKENTLGWYLPTDNTLKLKDMTVEVLTPAFTKVEYADDPTTGNPTFTIQTQNMPENAKVEVALEKKDVGAGGIDNATIKKDATRGSDGKYSVTFDKSEFESGAEYYLWFRYGSPGSDWAYESVTNRPTYTPNSTTGGGSDSSESGSGNTTEGSQAGA